MKWVLFYIAAITSNFPGVELDKKQTMCLATAIYSEAAGESVMAKADVGYVINNRRISSKYPDTFCKVVYQKHQFPNIEKRRINYNLKAWQESVEVAAFIQVGLIDNRVEGATLYYAPKLANPKWKRNELLEIGDVENHKFFIEKRIIKEMRVAYGY